MSTLTAMRSRLLQRTRCRARHRFLLQEPFNEPNFSNSPLGRRALRVTAFSSSFLVFAERFLTPRIARRKRTSSVLLVSVSSPEQRIFSSSENSARARDPALPTAPTEVLAASLSLTFSPRPCASAGAALHICIHIYDDICSRVGCV